MQNNFILTLLSLCVLFTQVYSHAWVSCTDYRITSKGHTEVYQDSQCHGFGRAWSQCCEASSFGLDRGYNFQPGNGKLCRNPLTGSNYGASYSTASPMASYKPGQQVCLAWAPKNHVSAACINSNIPDNGMEVYMSGANPTADATALSQMRKIADWGKNTVADGMKGFQNCPNFCSNPDKATCTGCFYIPDDAVVGATYSFIWTWEFNGLADQYSTCWEAKIVPNVVHQGVALPAGYVNIAPKSGTALGPSPPVATSRAVTPTSAAKTSAPRTTANITPKTSEQEPAATSEDTPYNPATTEQNTPATNGQPQRNISVVYVYAAGNGHLGLLQGYLLGFLFLLVLAVNVQ